MRLGVIDDEFTHVSQCNGVHRDVRAGEIPPWAVSESAILEVFDRIAR